MNINPTHIATRCLDAAANLDDDESASPAELAAIAATIALAIFDDADDILHQIHELLSPMTSDHDESDCDICIRFADDMR